MPSDSTAATVPTQAEIHYDSVADTACCYTQFQGWVLTCLWCPHQSRGRTKAEAIEDMQDHYDRVCGEGRVKVHVGRSTDE